LLNVSVASGPFEKYSLATASTATNARLTATTDVSSSSSATTSIQIQSPVDGQVVRPGSALDVTISTTQAASSVTVATSDEVLAANGQPLHARIDIPATAIGKYPIVALGFVANGEVAATDGIVVTVTPEGKINSLALSPLRLFLRVGESEQVDVQGVFQDGVARKMTGSTDLAYSSSNTSVAIVQPDGKVMAVGGGEAVIRVTAGEATGDLSVNVESAARRRAVLH
jgi:hypothetical protein